MSGYAATTIVGGLLVALIDWALLHKPPGWRRRGD